MSTRWVWSFNQTGAQPKMFSRSVVFYLFSTVSYEFQVLQRAMEVEERRLLFPQAVSFFLCFLFFPFLWEGDAVGVILQFPMIICLKKFFVLEEPTATTGLDQISLFCVSTSQNPLTNNFEIQRDCSDLPLTS